MFEIASSAAILYFLKCIILFFTFLYFFGAKYFINTFFSSENHFYSISCFIYCLFIFQLVVLFTVNLYFCCMSAELMCLASHITGLFEVCSSIPPSLKLMFSVGISTKTVL